MNVDRLQFVSAGQWPQVNSSAAAHSWIILPAQSDRLDDLQAAFFPAGSSKLRGLGLLGLADDTGVRLNHGREGARLGPDAVRAALAKYGLATSQPLAEAQPPVLDAGNIVPGRSLQETHDRVTATARQLWELGWLPVGIGGGHDLTFPLVRAIANATSVPLSGIYLDAHLDVRPQEGSGMAFRRLLEEGHVDSLRCLGLDPLANCEQHVQWFEQHGGSLDFFPPGDWPQARQQFVSIDLDVIDSSQAPGVSAMNPVGMPAADVAQYAEAAGRAASVCCFDIMELCPPHDEGGRTARLAAHLLLRFIQGCSARMTESADWTGSDS